MKRTLIAILGLLMRLRERERRGMERLHSGRRDADDGGEVRRRAENPVAVLHQDHTESQLLERFDGGGSGVRIPDPRNPATNL